MKQPRGIFGVLLAATLGMAGCHATDPSVGLATTPCLAICANPAPGAVPAPAVPANLPTVPSPPPEDRP
jgi:hypothetical protein